MSVTIHGLNGHVYMRHFYIALGVLQLVLLSTAIAQPKPVEEYLRQDLGDGLGPEYLAWRYAYDANGDLKMFEDRTQSQFTRRYSQFTRHDIAPWTSYLLADHTEVDIVIDPQKPPHRQVAQITRFSDTEQVLIALASDSVEWEMWHYDSIRYSSSGIMLFRSRWTSSSTRTESLQLTYGASGKIDSATEFAGYPSPSAYIMRVFKFYYGEDTVLDSAVVLPPPGFQGIEERFTNLKFADPPVANRSIHPKIRIVRDDMTEYIYTVIEDGVLRSSDTVSRTFDAKGRVITEDRPTKKLAYQYYAEDDAIEQTIEAKLSATGEWEIDTNRTEIRTYDVNGRLIERRSSHPQPHWIRRLVYADQLDVRGPKGGHPEVLYPNPASTSVTISDAENLSAVTIKDALGRTMLELRSPAPTIDVTLLPTGRYTVSLRSVSGIRVVPLLILR
jgi:hypothetical protein